MLICATGACTRHCTHYSSEILDAFKYRIAAIEVSMTS